MPSPTNTRAIKPAKEGQPSKPLHSRKGQPSARISAACEACKKRKTKCTGGPPPCQLCESLGTECVIDLSLDMRRRAALQRTMDESKSYQETLNRLIDCIREGPSPRFESLVECVRSGASNQEIADALHHLGGIVEEDGDRSMSLPQDGPESPPSKIVDEIKVLGGQIDGASLNDGEDTHMGNHVSSDGVGQLEWAKSSGSEQTGHLTGLLSNIKNLPNSEGEQLLRQFLMSQPRGGNSVRSRSDLNHWQLEAFERNAVAPTNAERSSWHPALHVQSRSEWPEGHRQSGQDGPLQRRFSYAASSMIKEEQTSPSSALTSTQSPRPPTARPSIQTNVPSYTIPFASPTHPYVELIGPSSPESPMTNAWDLCVAQEDQMTRLRIPIHLVLPLILPDDSYLSNMYTNYVQGARHMLETGVPLMDVLGSSDEVTMDLFFRNRTDNDKFDCASWACEVCRALVELDECVRLASAFLLTYMMRWLLVPTQENYLKIPDMMKPTPSQRMIPHIGAIEMLPLRPVRDALIYHMRDWLSELSRARWTVNWPVNGDSAIERNPVTGTTRLTPKFIEHASNYDNWSVSNDFLIAFPELSGRIRIHD